MELSNPGLYLDKIKDSVMAHVDFYTLSFVIEYGGIQYKSKSIHGKTPSSFSFDNQRFAYDVLNHNTRTITIWLYACFFPKIQPNTPRSEAPISKIYFIGTSRLDASSAFSSPSALNFTFGKTEISLSMHASYRAVERPADGPSTTMDDFSIIHVIGKGGYGKVMLVKRKESGCTYALKSLKKSAISFPRGKTKG
jgi:hypothetical protein